jgi:hypothetical protein
LLFRTAFSGFSPDASTRLYRRVGSQIRRVHFCSLHQGLGAWPVCVGSKVHLQKPRRRVPPQVRRLHIRWRNSSLFGRCHTQFLRRDAAPERADPRAVGADALRGVLAPQSLGTVTPRTAVS